MVYLPPLFTEAHRDVLVAHIERHAFGLLLSGGATGFEASRIPFLVERVSPGEDAGPLGIVLQGHLARPNPQVAQLAEAGEALAVFTGPHAYVSPTWYAAGPAVPTWNYADVHAYGRPRLMADEGWLRRLLARLSERYEAASPQAWRFDGQPPDYISGMLKGIVGFEIPVSRIEGKFKLSQNRPAADRPRIIAALDARGDDAARGVAELMRSREGG